MKSETILWREAASLAARAHRHHFRKDGVTPYVAHVFRVAMTVRHIFDCDDPVAITAALLHDTIEDTTIDYDDLREAFGKEVADCVAALTKNKAMPEPQREAAYDAQLAAADWRTRLIKLADVLDNYSDMASGEDRQKAVDRCRRAINLATADQHPCVKRAVEVVSHAAGIAR